MADHTPKKYPSLRFFITVTIMIIVGFVLLLSVGFYYIKTSSILRKTSRDSIVRELNQVNDTIQDQVETIDSVIPLFMSNEVIQNALENPDAGTNHPFSVDRQMSYIYNSSALSEKNFTDSIYIYNNHNIIYHAYTSGILEHATASAPSPIWHATLKDSSLTIISGYPGNSFSSSALNSSAIASLFV